MTFSNDPASVPSPSNPVPGTTLALRSPSEGPALIPRLPPVKTLSDLISLLGALERQERPDVVLPLSELRMREDGRIQVPGDGAYAMTAWARRQLSERLGIRWDRWFSSVTEAERAEEVNLRLRRSTSSVRLRAADVAGAEGGHAEPVLRAFVSRGYSPFSDAMVAELLAEAFRGAEASVHRVAYTDMTLSYALTVGEKFRPGGDAKVGDLHGGVIVRNSGVGYASLRASAYFLRLVCLNGMTMPVQDPTLLAAVHRGVREDAIRSRLAENAKRLGGLMAEGGERLLSARRVPVLDRAEEFQKLLQRARLPKRHLPALEAAYAQEPEASAFGVVQAATRASQALPSEARFDLERVANEYLVATHREQPFREGRPPFARSRAGRRAAPALRAAQRRLRVPACRPGLEEDADERLHPPRALRGGVRGVGTAKGSGQMAAPSLQSLIRDVRKKSD